MMSPLRPLVAHEVVLPLLAVQVVDQLSPYPALRCSMS